jgi:uncharacterized protein HemX
MALKPDIMYVSYYTAGSAAYDMNRKAEKPKAAPVHKRRRHAKKQRVIAVDPVAVVGILVAVCMFFALISGVQEYQDTLEQNQRMQAYMEQLQNENAALQHTYENSYDALNVYEMATAIGMVPQAQVEHVVIDVQIPQTQEVRLSFWENVSLFLTGLFA